MTSLLARVVSEKRTIVLPLVVALAANVLGYVLIVRPLGIKSAGAADRAVRAAATVQAAEKDAALAKALVSGKSDADQELGAFYQKVLPADLTAARRMTYASLPALARKTGVRYEARSTAIDVVQGDAKLGHMTIHMVLQGDYENIREFLFQLESAPEFVIIDDVTIAAGAEAERQTLTINLSTYYRLEPDAS